MIGIEPLLAGFQGLSPWWFIAPGLILLAILMVPYGLGPVLIYITHKQQARPHLVDFKPGVTPLPADVDQFFHSSSWALAQEGFEIITGMFLPSQIENIVVALIFLANRREKDGAIVVAMHSNSPVMTMTQFHIEFVSRYRDGRVIQTNNAESLNAFPTPPNTINSFLPSVRDPQQLYRIHQAVCRREGAGQKFLRLDEKYGGDAIGYMTDAMIEELDQASEAGYMRLDSRAGVYKPTLFGAVKMTYGELWPFKAIRKSRRAYREKQFLGDLAAEMR